MLNDVFIQMENPQAGQGAQINEDIAEALVHEVLEPVEPERPATPVDRVLEEIDEYIGEMDAEPEVGEDQVSELKERMLWMTAR